MGLKSNYKPQLKNSTQRKARAGGAVEAEPKPGQKIPKWKA